MANKKTLSIYPTKRSAKASKDASDAISVGEFYSNVVFPSNGVKLVDKYTRVFLLEEASKFPEFETLKWKKGFSYFLSKSNELFKFYEELASSFVAIPDISRENTYNEYDEYLTVLEKLQDRYRVLLRKAKLTDRMFFYDNYSINKKYLKKFDSIHFELSGFLNPFEFKLLDEISLYIPVVISMDTTEYNMKMQELFEAKGFTVKNNKQQYFNLNTGGARAKTVKNSSKISLYSTGERLNQISLAFEVAKDFISSGISPEEIVFVLPDEDMASHLAKYDKENMLNFAMGSAYSKSKEYKSIQAISSFWKTNDKKYKDFAIRIDVSEDILTGKTKKKTVRVDAFFETLEDLGLFDIKNEKLCELMELISDALSLKRLPFHQWLELWVNEAGKLTEDDVDGGKITVMGVLETRSVYFKAAIVFDFNDDIVPSRNIRDNFLNSYVRSKSGLILNDDRIALQKQYYHSLISHSENIVFMYSSENSKLPSTFIYDLPFPAPQHKEGDSELLYSSEKAIKSFENKDPFVSEFHPEKITWSSSQLETFLSCKRKYYYRYIQKIPRPKEKELIEGLFLHQLLDKTFSDSDSFETEGGMTEKIYSLLEEMHPDKSAKGDYQKILWMEKMKPFISQQINHFKEGWKVVQREYSITGSINGLMFTGRGDRIDVLNTSSSNVWELIDYKTGSTTEANKSRNFDTLTDFQMSIYKLILDKAFPGIMPVFINPIKSSPVISVVALEEKNEELFNKIDEIKKTSSFTAERCDNLQNCRFCEFSLLCERGDYL